ncbi:DUF7662 domain-containing protein [Brevundimonas sp. SL130]|uniref:DUF7662 domain-containing protein n=1 Tax=Brevundimonas sp. SL130 TaxID=2995143 RepID=UPI00226CF16F|nr:hypothetical protein [Brevundimonas sp. SL130]WAC59976.1 hypothetical protein OU998_00595 [Brevundimonas sp. SL130]
MGKYEPLTRYLADRPTAEVPMTFSEIERVLGAALPASKQYPAWWSNNPSNNVMTRAWLEAGFQTERVDIGREKLVFRRIRPEDRQNPSSARPNILERIRHRLAGTVTIPPGVDVTQPTGDVWAAECD